MKRKIVLFLLLLLGYTYFLYGQDALTSSNAKRNYAWNDVANVFFNRSSPSLYNDLHIMQRFIVENREKQRLEKSDAQVLLSIDHARKQLHEADRALQKLRKVLEQEGPVPIKW